MSVRYYGTMSARDGRELGRLRAEVAGKTQAQFAPIAGISIGNISRAERNKRISRANAEAIVGALQRCIPNFRQTVEDLFTPEGTVVEAAVPQLRGNESSPPPAADLTSRPEIIESRLPAKLLQLYYPDDELAAHGLFRYSYSIGSSEVTTKIVTSHRWRRLSLPIGPADAHKFAIREGEPPWRRTTSSEVQALRAELGSRGITFHDKPIYGLQSFNPRGRPTIATFVLGQYADYKLKLGKLEEELSKALAESNFDPETADRSRELMPFRNELLPDAATIANYSERLCAGGTNILLAFRRADPDDFVFFVKRRSSKVSTGKGILSLLPSGMHQPTTRANAQEESSVAVTVFREMYEELFGGKEVEGEDRHLKPLWFMGDSRLAWFVEHRRSFKLEIVSFGLNLLDGTYEFGVLLAIRDPRYWDEFGDDMEPNEEFDDAETRPFSTMDADRLSSLLTNPRCADVSLIALVEGLKRLHELEPRRVRLPRIKVAGLSEFPKLMRKK